jgi:hypothetical protein
VFLKKDKRRNKKTNKNARVISIDPEWIVILRVNTFKKSIQKVRLKKKNYAIHIMLLTLAIKKIIISTISEQQKNPVLGSFNDIYLSYI